jgi:hypothetical protein
MFADEQSTMPSAAQQNFVQGVVRGLPKDWGKEVLRRVRAVTEDEIKTALLETVLPCFEPGKSNIVVTAAKIMQEVCFTPRLFWSLLTNSRVWRQRSRAWATRSRLMSLATSTMITA